MKVDVGQCSVLWQSWGYWDHDGNQDAFVPVKKGQQLIFW